MKRPSQKSIDLFNQLVERQNKVRRQLKRIHQHAEETLGAGRLPALIIPKSGRKIKPSYFEGLSPAELHRRLKAYWSKLGQLKEEFSRGLRSYLAKTVKNGYMELWRDQIELHSGETPEAFHNLRYSKDQIENSDYGAFMETYNKLFMMSPEVFLAMLYSGRLISFKYIYRELERVGRGGAEGSWLEEQNELLAIGPKEQAKLVEKVIKDDLADDYKHSKKTMDEVKAKEKGGNKNG